MSKWHVISHINIFYQNIIRSLTVETKLKLVNFEYKILNYRNS